MNVEVEAVPHDVGAEVAALASLRDGVPQPLHGQRVFGPDVNITLRGPDCVSGDDHAFDHRVRIALDDGAVHEGAGITFIGIADQELLVARRLCGKTPTSCPWESQRRRGP